MRFTFKMFVLVGLILVGKFLKEDSANGTVQKVEATSQNIYSLDAKAPLPFTQKTNHILEPVTKEGTTTEKTFTYSLN
ncbi:hypothetical protein [Rufibacter ruber]|uniref:hypothetical protein n=1 Tax=Rufibacter ruber TaxID=1783499 RepID=UPI00082B2E2E|nr:hypothetical protein [Rufibacter ruber]